MQDLLGEDEHKSRRESGTFKNIRKKKEREGGGGEAWKCLWLEHALVSNHHIMSKKTHTNIIRMGSAK